VLAPVEHVRRRATCASVAGLLPAVADGDARLEGAAAAHVATCLRCQADLARYRRLRRTLRSLGEPMGPGPEVLPAILAALDQAGLPRAAHTTVRWVVTTSAIGATVVGAGLLVLARHRRPFAR
jgi:anti-sigma factor RsiW